MIIRKLFSNSCRLCIAISTVVLILAHTSSFSQSIDSIPAATHASFRGLSVVDDRVVWVSGSGGTVGRSTDGGKSWKWMQVKGFEKNDFRDIEAFDPVTAIVMSIGDPAYILKTTDGGASWKIVLEDKRKGMFLDAMEFWNEQSGIVIGDPVDGKIYVARTFDGGDHWRGIPDQNYPVGVEGEAMFASSGTNIRKLNLSEACFVTGGTKSRLFIRDKKIDIPIVQGKETTGANSVAISNPNKNNHHEIVVVGGDFSADTVTANNCAITKDEGKTWIIPITPPHGYRSCVEFIDKNTLVCCGTSGVDISTDGGINWKLLSRESYHVCRKAKNGNAVFLAGGNGRIARFVYGN